MHLSPVKNTEDYFLSDLSLRNPLFTRWAKPTLPP